MNFNFGENLKQLRKAKGFTQEEVSELLNVSKQSISRWETGVTYPDISFLPILASFYSVTVDHLLGADYERNQTILNDYLARRQEAHHVGDMKGAYELSKELYTSFPNNNLVMNNFMTDSYLMGLHNEGNYYLEQCVSVAQRFLKMTEDIEEQCRCIKYVAMCNKLLGNYEKSNLWLKKLPSMWSCIETAAIEVFDGQEKIDSIQCSFDTILHMLYTFTKEYGENQNLTAKERISVLKKMPAILETFFEKEDYGFYHVYFSRIYLQIAQYCVADETQCIEALNLAIAHAKRYDSLKNAKHDSILWKGRMIDTSEFTKKEEKTQLQKVYAKLEGEEFSHLKEKVAL